MIAKRRSEASSIRSTSGRVLCALHHSLPYSRRRSSTCADDKRLRTSNSSPWLISSSTACRLGRPLEESLQTREILLGGAAHRGCHQRGDQLREAGGGSAIAQHHSRVALGSGVPRGLRRCASPAVRPARTRLSRTCRQGVAQGSAPQRRPENLPPAGGAVFHWTASMLTYHEGALSGFAAYAATAPRGRRITVSVETSTAMCTSPRLPSSGQRHLDHRSRLHGLPNVRRFSGAGRRTAVYRRPFCASAGSACSAPHSPMPAPVLEPSRTPLLAWCVQGVRSVNDQGASACS